jgi:hypothetical protein
MLLVPDGWQGRLQPAYSGVALTLVTLGRADLLKSLWPAHVRLTFDHLRRRLGHAV